MFKQARAQLGMTPAEMADAMGVSVVAVSQWEREGGGGSRLLDAIVFLHSLGKLEEFKSFRYTGGEIKQRTTKRGHCALATALRVFLEGVDQCSSKHECS